jgi:hypothetical protein
LNKKNNMRKVLTLLCVMTGMLSTAQNFTAGNIVVSRVGNGGVPLAATKTAPVTIQEFDKTGLLTKSVALDTSGANRITFYGGANAAAQITRSADGRFLFMSGYDTTTQTNAAVASTTKRVVARIDDAGTVDYSTRYTSAATVSTALSDSGTRIWLNGTGTGSSFLGYDTLGKTTPPYYVNGIGPARAMNIQKKQLYNLRGFGDIIQYKSTNNITTDPNPGLPSSPNINTSNISSSTFSVAVALSTNVSADGFVFFDIDPSVDWNNTGYDVVYVSNVNAGLEKYYWSALDSAWKPSNSQFQVPVTINDPGSGYTTAPTVTITSTDGFTPPTPGTARAIVSNGGVTHIVILNNISAYTSIPSITIADPPGGGTTASASFDALTPRASGFFTKFGACAQIAGTLNQDGKPVIYAVSGNGTATNNVLIAITDNGIPEDSLSILTGVTVDSITRAGVNYAFRGVALSPDVPFAGTIYTFNGNGNWNVAANWVNNTIPPTPLPTGARIVIDNAIGGQCVLNVPQTVSPGGSLIINAGKRLVTTGNLTIQ